MARTGSNIAVAQGASFTGLFLSANLGGTDGGPWLGGYVINRGAVDLEVRTNNDGAAVTHLLKPGENMPFNSRVRPILQIQARGVGAAGVAQLDETVF